MIKSHIAHKIKHREIPNDEFITPQELANKLVKMVPLMGQKIVCDNAYGTGVFYKALREHSSATIVQFSKDFFNS